MTAADGKRRCLYISWHETCTETSTKTSFFVKNFVQENCSTNGEMTETKSTRTGRKTRCLPGKHPGLLYIVTRDRGGRDDVMRKSILYSRKLLVTCYLHITRFLLGLRLNPTNKHRPICIVKISRKSRTWNLASGHIWSRSEECI